jgi:hypothetical protein
MKKVVVVVIVVLGLLGGGVFVYRNHLRREIEGNPRMNLVLDASKFLVDRIKAGELVGFAKGEHGRMSPTDPLDPADHRLVYPFEIRFDAHKANDSNLTYRYSLRKTAADADWVLTRAQQLGPGDAVTELLPMQP